MAEAVLKIQDLTVAFGTGKKRQFAVSHLNVNVQRGQCLGLVGESGSGKSLTALTVMQLLPYAAEVSDRSHVWWKGKDLLNFSEKAMRRIRGLEIGMIFQDAMSALNPVLTIGQQMNEILRKKQRRRLRQRAYELFEEVGIDNPERLYRSYPHELSGGMRQRAMIAIALSGEPQMMIADEPTTALDVTIQAQILTLLNKLKSQRNMGLLFISHDLAVVSEVADEISVLKAGKLVEQADRRSFFHNPQSEYSRRLLAAIPPREARHAVVPSARDNSLLNIKNLKVYFPIRKGILKRKVGDVKAVDGIDLSLSTGKTLALVGESGSGKTTAAKTVVRLLKITSGDIFFDGKNLTTLSQRKMKPVRSDIQMIFQDPYSALNPRRSVADSIAEGMSTQKIIRGRAAQLARVDELLEQVGLSPDWKWRYPHEFSGGERQRICIARALALKPKLLILDEPTSALDVSIQMQVLKLLEQLQQKHELAYLLITHNLGVVAYLAHDVAVMKKGQIVEQGPAEVLLRSPTHPYTKKLLASIPKIEE